MYRMTYLVLIVGLFFIGCEKKAAKDPFPAAMDTLNQVVPTQTELTLMDKTETTVIPSQPAQIPAMDTTVQTEAISGGVSAVTDFKSIGTKEIQQALKNANLYAGKIDGSLGPKTKEAIMKFQEQNGLKADGKVGPKTWEKLAPFLTQAAEPQVQGSTD